MHPTAAAIIVNYNGQETLHDCLQSVTAQSIRFSEIIVVDNNSPDRSAEGLEEEFPQVRVIRQNSNAGYAAASNVGITNCGSDLVAILNNDIILDNKWLENMLARVSPDWDFWTSLVVFADSPEAVDSAGDGMTVIGAAYKSGHRQSSSLFSKDRESFGACAAAALYRRELLDATGGFDEDFFLIYEDADLSFRARLLGFRCLFVHQARVYHRVNFSIGTFSETYVYYGQRNSETVFWKNMPGSLLLLYLPERILFNLLSFAYFSWKGKPFAFCRAKIDFFRSLFTILHRRRAIQIERKLSARELRKSLDRNWLKNRLK